MASPYRSVIGLLVVICILVLTSHLGIMGAFIHNLVAVDLIDEFAFASQENLGSPCGFARDSVQGTVLASLAQRATDLQPESPAAWLGLGRTRWGLGQCNEALEALTISSDLYDGYYNPAQFELARALYSLGERKRSITIFRSLRGARHVAKIAYRARQIGDYGLALVLYELALEIEPLPEIRAGFRVVAEDVLNLPASQAEAAWRRLSLETPSDQAAYWLAVGELALLASDPLAAKNAFLRGLGLSGDPYYLYSALARTSVKLGDWNEAITHYMLALKVEPTTSVMPYVKIAEIETRLGNYAEVVAWCDKARSLFPDSHWPDFVQGYAALQLGRLDEAETLFKIAHNKAPSDVYSLSYLGLIKQYQGDFLRAAEYYNEAVTTNPSVPEACDWLLLSGDLYGQVGNTLRSRSNYEIGSIRCKNNAVFLSRLNQP